MSAFQVYIDARAVEASMPDVWDNADKLQEIEARVRTDLGGMYRFLNHVDARLAELRGPAVLPKRASNRTATQERVARCPRCGGHEVAA